MEDDLVGVVDGNGGDLVIGDLLMHLFASVFKAVRALDEALSQHVRFLRFLSCSLVDSHDHFVSVDVHVSLHERDGLGEDVVASTD